MNRNRRTRSRGLARLAGCLALGLAAALSLSGTAVADQAGNEEKITSNGERPPAPVNMPNYGTTTKGDTPVAVVVSGGLGGKLNIVDLTSGKAIVQKDFADESNDVQPWGFATLSDKSVLIAAGESGLWRYDPKDDSVEHLIEGKTEKTKKAEFFWDVVVDENDTAYIVTKNNGGGRVLTWNKDSGLGFLKGGDPVDPEQPQARSIAYDNGKVYVAVGASAPKVYQIDPKTGAKEALSLPAEVCPGDSGLLPHLEARTGKLYVESCDEKRNLVHDLVSGKSDWLNDASGKVISRPGEAKKVYYARNGQLVEYDPDTARHTSLPAGGKLLTRLSPSSWATHDMLVSSQMFEGKLTIYDATKQGADSFKAVDGSDVIKPSGRAIQSMVAADNGRLFASWYMSAEQLLSVTPGEKADGATFKLLDSPAGQGEGMAVNGDTLVVGLYPKAKVTSRPTTDDSYKGDVNVIDGQDRPYAITHTADNVFAIGTVPGDGQLGGALTFYDANAHKIQKTIKFDSLSYAAGVPQDRLTQQSPISVAYRNGKLYIGTTARGGHSNVAVDKQTNKPQEAQLVEFDVASSTVTRVVNPFEGEGQNAITALTFGDDGMLYGITGAKVFKVDTASFAITKNEVLREGTEVNRSWLVQHGGQLFGVLQGNLYAIQTGDLTSKSIADGGVGALTLGKDGYLYYARGANIYRNDYAKAGR